MADPFETITQGVTSGLGYATRFQELGLQRQRLEIQKEQHAELLKRSKIETALKAVSVLDKARSMPQKTGRAYLKSLMPSLKDSGVEIDSALETSLWDPEMTQVYGKALLGLKRGLQSGNVDMSAIFSEEVVSQLGEGKSIEMINGVFEDLSKLERAAATYGGKALLQDLKIKAQKEMQQAELASEERIADKRITQQKFEEKERKYTQLQKDAGAIVKEFEPVTASVAKVQALANAKGGTVSQAMIRLTQQLSENRNSVVQETEFARAAGAAPIWERVKTYFQSAATGDKVPDSIRRDMNDLAKRVQVENLKRLKARLTPIAEDLKARGGGMKEARRTLGPNARLFGSMFGQKAKRKGVNLSAAQQQRISALEKKQGRKFTPREISILRAKLIQAGIK